MGDFGAVISGMYGDQLNSASCVHFRGLVPLHNACSYGHFEVTELLLKVSCCCPQFQIVERATLHLLFSVP